VLSACRPGPGASGARLPPGAEPAAGSAARELGGTCTLERPRAPGARLQPGAEPADSGAARERELGRRAHWNAPERHRAPGARL